MKMSKAEKKIGKVMGEYKEGKLHSGKSKKIEADEIYFKARQPTVH